MLGIVARVRAIMLSPHTEWDVIRGEAASGSSSVLRYVAVLAAIPAVARFIGGSLIGGYTPMLHGLSQGVARYLLSFVLIYMMAWIANLLAPSFDTQKDFSQVLRLTVYAYTPVWLAGVFLVVPGLSFLSILGAYGVYLFWLGLPGMMGTPARPAWSYAAVIGVTGFFFEVLLRAMLYRLVP